MNPYTSMVVGLAQSAATLLAVATLIGILYTRARAAIPRLSPAAVGAICALAAMLDMARPVIIGQGYQLDMRAVLIGVSFLVGGPVSGWVTGVVVALFRAAQGGPQVTFGVMIIGAYCVVVYLSCFRLAPWRSELRHARRAGLALAGTILLFSVLASLRSPDGLVFYLGRGAILASITFVSLYALAIYIQSVQQYAHLAEALAQKQRLLEVTLDHIADGVITLDPEGRILGMNESAEALTHWSRDEALGRPVEEVARVVGQDTDDSSLGMMPEPDGAMSTDEPVELAPTRGGATPRHVHLTIVPIAAEGDRREGRVVSIRDVTDTHALEQELRQAAKMESIAELAGGVAHDFNNLLVAVLGNAELLLLDHTATDAGRVHAQNIVDAAHRGAGIARKLLLFSKQTPPSLGPVRIDSLIHEVIELVRPSFDPRIQLALDLDPRVQTVQGDADQLQQVLVNMAINARDAMPDGGVVTFRLRPLTSEDETGDIDGARYVCLEVEDTGEGIPPEVIDRIFDPFFTTKEVGRGTGLGLASVYGIVAHHEGQVRVESTLGEGTCFFILLPIAAGELAETERQTVVDTGGACTILIAEDDPVIRRLLEEQLLHMGHEVLQVPDGEAAVDLYRDGQGLVDMVILDMNMPRLNGRECFETLREMNPDLRAVVITGRGDEALRSELMAAGVVDVLLKPFTLADLSEVVGEALGGARPAERTRAGPR